MLDGVQSAEIPGRRKYLEILPSDQADWTLPDTHLGLVNEIHIQTSRVRHSFR